MNIIKHINILFKESIISSFMYRSVCCSLCIHIILINEEIYYQIYKRVMSSYNSQSIKYVILVNGYKCVYLHIDMIDAKQK